ncbi:MAG: DUF5615 family PIN-like protein [Nitrospinae bacterium]|nr:DUF5615 family PIN-like protein [Nitrospinota bacterium]
MAVWLREQGHDVVETKERGADPGDRVILEWAVAEQRVLITMDKDFGELVFSRGSAHCGIVRLPDLPAEGRIELMQKLFKNHSNELEEQLVITIRGERIRISRPLI